MPRKRGHNTGSFYQLPSGRWRAVLTVHHPDGTARRKYLERRTKREAMAAAAAYTAALAESAEPPPSAETVAAFLTRWLRDAVAPSVRPSTHTAYALNVRRLLPHIGGLRVVDLRPADVERAYAALLARGLSRRSVEQAHTVLHTALEKAMDWEIVTRNVTARVTVPRPARTAMTALTRDQVARLLASSEGTRWHPFWTLAVTAGLRLGELSALTWADIDLDGRRLSVRRALGRQAGKGLVLSEPKTERSRRTLPLTAIAVEALRRLRVRQAEERLAAGPAYRDEGLVFCSIHGRRLDPARVREALLRALAAAGLPRIRVHDLRHTCATLMLDAGISPKVVADYLGHSTVVLTLDTYSHATMGHYQQVTAHLDGLLGGAESASKRAAPSDRGSF